MKRLIIQVAALVLAVITLTSPVPARADGIIIPEPPVCLPGPCPPIPFPLSQLSIRYHHVDVTIEDQVAVTHVDQVFYNPNEWDVEGIYLFPIPRDAVVTSFTLWVNGEAVEAQILDAQEARRTYEEIVNSLRDPALLEYVDQGAVQARIFPIPSRGERRIELEYSQVLTAENGLVRYVYPLSTEKFSRTPLESVAINLKIRSSIPVRAVYSPTHSVTIDRENDQQMLVGFEAENILPDSDFGLYYSIGDEEAFHLLTYRDSNDPLDPDGFFMLLLAPRPNIDQRALPKDVLLVLDKSGSMEGEKFRQAQEALRFILNNLNPEDRFNIVSFSTDVTTYAPHLRSASEAAEAQPWVDRLNAAGSTDINRALLEAAALAEDIRPTYVIFLTDGLPTVGEVDSQKILDNLSLAVRPNLRLFSFGVGYDVDTFLLDSLSQAHRGASTYVLPGDRLDEVLSDFYTKVSTPVLTDLELDFGELAVYDLYPQPLPDLFAGSQIILVGRYRQPDETTITLTGEVNGEAQLFHYPEQIFPVSNQELSASLTAIPRLWATRKVGYLLNQVRLLGPDQETIDQIVRLSIRYGIITPYTSYLVSEELPLGAADQGRIAEEQFKMLQTATEVAPYGQDAVQMAAEQGVLAGADTVASAQLEDVAQVRVVGTRTYISKDGVWVDTAYDPQVDQTIKVAFLSDDYFRLVGAQPELAVAFALGERVIAFADGVPYEVVQEGASVPGIEIGSEATPVPGGGSLSPSTAVPTDKPDQTPVASPRTGTCTAGLLPAVFVPFLLLIAQRKRKNSFT
jgi:Ca-activated chloride channel family protein